MNKHCTAAKRLWLKPAIALASLCLSFILTNAIASESGGKPIQEHVAASTDMQDAEVSVWVDAASLKFVLGQLAYLSGRQSVIEGELDGQVSGRFSGSMSGTLTALSTAYPVLFDADEAVLYTTSSNARSSVSIALERPEQLAKHQSQWLDGLLPGNTIEYRDDAILVSGHPAFVKRMVKSVTSSIAADRLHTSTAVVSDAGADAMLRDITENTASTSAQAQLSKPIKWVTDIPGFNTF